MKLYTLKDGVELSENRPLVPKSIKINGVAVAGAESWNGDLTWIDELGYGVLVKLVSHGDACGRKWYIKKLTFFRPKKSKFII